MSAVVNCPLIKIIIEIVCLSYLSFDVFDSWINAPINIFHQQIKSGSVDTNDELFKPFPNQL